MVRVSIIMSEQTLEAVDHAAAKEHISRSALLQKAARQYLRARKATPEGNKRKQAMEQAAATMDRLADTFGKWDGIGTIRRFRDRRTGVKR